MLFDRARQVRDALRTECYDDVRLIDAHSFCWMNARKALPEVEEENHGGAAEAIAGLLRPIAVEPASDSEGSPPVRPSIGNHCDAISRSGQVGRGHSL
jgi:hypothetical protein